MSIYRPFYTFTLRVCCKRLFKHWDLNKWRIFSNEFMNKKFCNLISWKFILEDLVDDKSLPWWRHQMETFSALLALCAGHWSMVNSPHKGQWRGAVMFCLIYAWINGWVNTGEAGDLRRHRAHYDVIVMTGSDTDLVPSGNKAHAWTDVDKIYVAIWGHWGTVN